MKRYFVWIRREISTAYQWKRSNKVPNIRRFWWGPQEEAFGLKHLITGFVNKHRFYIHEMLTDVLDWCGLLCVFISCLDSFWRHPFTAEHVMEKLIYIRHGLKHFQLIFIFGLTISLKSSLAINHVWCLLFVMTMIKCVIFKCTIPHINYNSWVDQLAKSALVESYENIWLLVPLRNQSSKTNQHLFYNTGSEWGRFKIHSVEVYL